MGKTVSSLVGPASSLELCAGVLANDAARNSQRDGDERPDEKNDYDGTKWQGGCRLHRAQAHQQLRERTDQRLEYAASKADITTELTSAELAQSRLDRSSLHGSSHSSTVAPSV